MSNGSNSGNAAVERGAHRDPARSLVPTLGLLDVTLIGMGTIIGAGIFRAPSEIAERVPSIGGILLLWALGGAIAMCGALVFAELGAMFPRTGGQYVFVREGFGRFAAFTFGWMLLAAIVAPATAYVANVFVDHLDLLVHGAGGAVWSPGSKQLIAVFVIAALSALNIRGVKLGAVVQDLSMGAKIAGILVIVALAVYAAIAGTVPVGAGSPTALPATTGPIGPRGGVYFGASLGASGAALLQVLFAVGGWQNIAAVATEIKDPQRTLPRGMLIGTVIVIALYMSVNWAVLSILGVEATAHSKTPAADAAAKVVAWGGPLISGLVVLSTFAFIQAILLVTPRIFFAMAEDGAFFRSAARVHPTWKTPWIAILLQGAFTCGYVLWQQALYLLEVATLCDYIFFTLCALAYFKLRRTRPDLARPYRAPGHPWFPGIFLLAAASVLVNAVISAQPTAVAIAGGVLALGFALYFFWHRSPGRSAA